uniref:Uncharacterized protein n=1 Tax=Opuntia streptacantha TaxID=393608 RepID=A0A7C9DHH5_OPUST
MNDTTVETLHSPSCFYLDVAAALLGSGYDPEPEPRALLLPLVVAMQALPSLWLGLLAVLALPLPIMLVLAGVPRVALIWWTTLQMWLLMVDTLDRFNLALGIVLVWTWSPTVRRHPGSDPEVDDSESVGPRGVMEKPMGRRGMQDGSSPLITSWM